MYTKKIEEQNDKTREKYRLVYMQMDWIARVFTGEDTKLLSEFENSVERKARVDTGESSKSLEQRIKDEEDMLSGLASIGFKVKE